MSRQSDCHSHRVEEHRRCFLVQAGAAANEPCWGELTIVRNVLTPDEGGGEPGDIHLCEGHLPIARGAPYQPPPNIS